MKGFNMKLINAIKHLNPCKDAVEWMGDMTIAEAWNYATRSDWMMWLLSRSKYPLPDSDYRRMACRFIRETPLGDGRTVWDLLTDERSRNAVIVAERFANGNATDDELDAAAADAWAAYTKSAADAEYTAYSVVAAVQAVSAAESATGPKPCSTRMRYAAWEYQCSIIREYITATQIEQHLHNLLYNTRQRKYLELRNKLKLYLKPISMLFAVIIASLAFLLFIGWIIDMENQDIVIEIYRGNQRDTVDVHGNINSLKIKNDCLLNYGKIEAAQVDSFKIIGIKR